jgi:site-specific DNA-methyltransferase (cytosine-N4-specific)
LFKAKNISTSEEFVRYALNAFLSSQEETIFGNLLENLAVHICAEVFGGTKAPQKILKSVDLTFVRDGNYYIVGIKSSFNWGNADQIGRMKTNFKTAKALLRSNGETRPIVAVNGCMYGTDNVPFKQDSIDPEMSYYKYCGEVFWEFISGDSQLYLDIIKPLDVEARRRSAELDTLYVSKINEMAIEFGNEFITGGQIDWEKLVRYVSAKSSRYRQVSPF